MPLDARPVPSIPPSETPSRPSATTPTLTEMISRPPAPPQALGPVAGYAHVQLDPVRRTVRSRAVSVSIWGAPPRPWRRTEPRLASPPQSMAASWSASVAMSP